MLDFLRARVASSSLEAGNAALAPLLVMEPRCRVCQAGAGLRSGIVLGSSEQNQTQSPRTERWSPKLSLLEKQSWKKNPSSPCLACSTACLGFVSLGSQRSLLQSPECVWLLNSAAQKGDQDLFASPGQILLL